MWRRYGTGKAKEVEPTAHIHMLHSFDQHPINDLSPLTDEATDEQLMQHIQRGEEAALSILHRRHHTLIRTIISRMMTNDHDVDELIQDCLLEVWRHSTNYNVEKGRALGWIVTLVRRRTIDRIRRKTAYGRAQDRFREETIHETEATHSGADEEAVRTDRAQIVTQLISKLPAPQQEAVCLAYYRGMTQRQIASHTKTPLGTVKTRLELGLRKLRAAVLAFGELHEASPQASA